MKPKTARKYLVRNEWLLAQINRFERRLYMKRVKPYLNVLKKDMANPASLRIRNRFLLMGRR